MNLECYTIHTPQTEPVHSPYDALFTVNEIRIENEAWKASFSSIDRMYWNAANQSVSCVGEL